MHPVIIYHKFFLLICVFNFGKLNCNLKCINETTGLEEHCMEIAKESQGYQESLRKP